MSFEDREWQIYKNRTQLSFKPFAKISRAKGWNPMTDWSASWIGKDNMIDGIDTFKKWEFGIVSLKPSKKEYLYLKETLLSHFSNSHSRCMYIIGSCYSNYSCMQIVCPSKRKEA